MVNGRDIDDMNINMQGFTNQQDKQNTWIFEHRGELQEKPIRYIVTKLAITLTNNYYKTKHISNKY